MEKEQVVKTAKVYDERLCKEVTEERRKLGKRNKVMTTPAAAPEVVLLKKQYLKPILTAVCS